MGDEARGDAADGDGPAGAPGPDAEERAPDGTDPGEEPGTDEPSEDDDPQTLREAVEAKYDFDDFRPADMAEMSLEEWEAAFDPDSWLTGPALVDRVEAELLSRVAGGRLFAVVERHAVAGEPHLLVYSDAEYAVVHPDGAVDGEGGLRREVEPVVALCSMEDFEVAEPPPDAGLPDPADVAAGSGDLGHRLLLVLAAVQVVAGVVLLLAPVAVRLGPGAGALTTVVGLGFLVIGLVLGLVVANARLSDRFRAAEYRDRLRAAGVGAADRPSFLPAMTGDDLGGGATDADEAVPGDDEVARGRAALHEDADAGEMVDDGGRSSDEPDRSAGSRR